MTALQTPIVGSPDVLGASDPVRAPDYDWPLSPLLELWALRVRLDALITKGEAREGWVSCRLLRRTMG